MSVTFFLPIFGFSSIFEFISIVYSNTPFSRFEQSSGRQYRRRVLSKRTRRKIIFKIDCQIQFDPFSHFVLPWLECSNFKILQVHFVFYLFHSFNNCQCCSNSSLSIFIYCEGAFFTDTLNWHCFRHQIDNFIMHFSHRSNFIQRWRFSSCSHFFFRSEMFFLQKFVSIGKLEMKTKSGRKSFIILNGFSTSFTMLPKHSGVHQRKWYGIHFTIFGEKRQLHSLSDFPAMLIIRSFWNEPQ